MGVHFRGTKIHFAYPTLILMGNSNFKSEDEKIALRDDLTRWYSERGDGICLSLRAGRLWRNARHSLTGQPDEKIKEEFSLLKTQLKQGIKG
jgi:hypothetical protein